MANGLVGLRGANVQDFALPADAPDRRIAHGGLPDLGVGLLVGAGRGPGVGDVVVPAVVGDLVFGPQTAHQSHGLGTAGAPLRHARAEGLALLGTVAQADAQNEASLRDMVERRDLLGYLHRVQQRQQQHRRRQFHVARLGRQPGQHRPRLEMLERIDQIMVGPAVDIEPGVPGRPELPQVVLPLLLVVDGIPPDDLPDLITDAHLTLRLNCDSSDSFDGHDYW